MLFNLVSFYTPDPHAKSSEEKQERYRTSRAPLIALMEKVKRMEEQLCILSPESREYAKLSKRIRKLQENITRLNTWLHRCVCMSD